MIKETAQQYTSQNTCKHMVNTIYKHIDFKPNSIILDYGAGKFGSNKEFIEALGRNIVFLRYDKYNIPKEENEVAIDYCLHHAPDYIICNNVLNVIAEDSIIEEILENIYQLSDTNTEIVFEIYEGDKRGVGKPTTLGYQRNQYTDKYLKFFGKFSTKRVGHCIYARKLENF